MGFLTDYTIFYGKRQLQKGLPDKFPDDLAKPPETDRGAPSARRKQLNVSVFEIFDFLSADGSDIETAGHFLPPQRAEILRDEPIPAPFFAVHRLGGQSVHVARPRFHFHEAIVPVFQRNDIRLAEGGLIIALYEFVTVFFEVFAGEILSLPSQNLVTKVLR